MTAYTIHQQAAVADGIQTDTASYNLGMEFEVSQNCHLTGIWFYSVSGATTGALPNACAIYNAVTKTQIASTLNSSPSWSGAAGSGWVKCTYPGTDLLVPGTKYELIIHGPTSAVNWYTIHQHFWDTGTGSAGITNGPLSAPNNTTSVNGQEIFTTSASIAFPSGTFNSLTFWIDVEVTPVPALSTSLLLGTTLP